MIRVLTLLSCLVFCFSARAADSNIGTIENSAGSAFVLHEVKALPATAGAILQLNDIVRTETGGLLRLVLADGSALLVQENTELRIVKFDTDQQQTLVELLHGRILAEVAPYTKPSGRFEVVTPTASVLAIGTTLAVETTSTQTGNTLTQRELENLPTTQRDLSSLIKMAGAVANPIKPTKPSNSTGQPSQPTSLLDISPGAQSGKTTFSLRDYFGVNSTIVGSLNHFVALSSPDPNGPGLKLLLPGQSAEIGRNDIHDYGADLGGPIMKDKLWFWGSYGKSDIRATRTMRDFGPNGQPCTPGIVVNGQPVATGDAMPNFDYKVLGAGTSTGNALQVHVTNKGVCPLYFYVPAGTVLQPKGFTERVITGLLFGSGVPNLKDFQKMITFGIFLRLGPLGLVTAEPPVLASSDVTEPMRSYCVQLHKLAPHPKTEYKFGDEGDQKEYGDSLSVLSRVFQLLQTRQLQSSAGHGLDSIIQWSLWAKLEKMDQKEFVDAYEKLVKKNFEAKNQKIDKETERRVKDSEQDLWNLVQVVLK